MLTTACSAGQASESAAPAEPIVVDTPTEQSNSTTPEENPEPTAEDADEDTEEEAAPRAKKEEAPAPPDQFIAWGNCSAAEVADPWADYVVGAESLNARLLPGVDEPVITALPGGTDVTVYADATDCTRLRNGSVWWFVNTPLLATGGYVHSSYLYDISLETDEGYDPGPYDGVEIEVVQLNCVYNNDPVACDRLIQLGYDADSTWGLGNSLTMTPDHYLVQECLADSMLACAELNARGPGADAYIRMISYIDAYQTGDLAIQQSFAGPLLDQLSGGVAVNSNDPQALTGIDSMWSDGAWFGWTITPGTHAECVMLGGLVQACEIV